MSVNHLVNRSQNATHGEDSAAIDLDVLDKIFGASATSPQDSAPHDGYTGGNDINMDVNNTSCSSHTDFGFRCVQYYECQDGLIIKDGAIMKYHLVSVMLCHIVFRI